MTLRHPFCQFQCEIRHFLSRIIICRTKCAKLFRNTSFCSIHCNFQSGNFQPAFTRSDGASQFPAHSSERDQFLYKSRNIFCQFLLPALWNFIIRCCFCRQLLHRLRLLQCLPQHQCCLIQLHPPLLICNFLSIRQKMIRVSDFLQQISFLPSDFHCFRSFLSFRSEKEMI